MEISEVIGWIIGIFGIIGFISSAILFIFKTGKYGGNMQTELKDLTEACNSNAGSISKLENKHEEIGKKVAILESDNERTTDSIKRLFDKMEGNHTSIMKILINLNNGGKK